MPLARQVWVGIITALVAASANARTSLNVCAASPALSDEMLAVLADSTAWRVASITWPVSSLRDAARSSSTP
jgi:hypothetical protein